MSSCPSCGHLNAAEVKFCGECGTRLQATTGHDAGGAMADVDSLPFAVGSTIAQGRYRLDAVLGRGGMGTVYRATDLSLDRQCALKVLNAELTAHPTARKRMEREARALARIEHPNVVQIRSVFVEGELLAMELEYMSGGDLRGLIEQGTLTPERVATLMQSILSGLQALHEAQLVHRDIKPENVLLDSRGEPKLTDLGVARDDAESGRTRTRLGAVLGTLEYMSPEQIQGLGVDARSDIYACGVMLVQMLTGALPFSAKSDFEWQVAHVQQEPELSRVRAAHPGLAEVAARALAKEADERWQSAELMAEAMRWVNRRDSAPHASPSSARDGKHWAETQRHSMDSDLQRRRSSLARDLIKLRAPVTILAIIVLSVGILWFRNWMGAPEEQGVASEIQSKLDTFVLFEDWYYVGNTACDLVSKKTFDGQHCFDWVEDSNGKDTLVTSLKSLAKNPRPVVLRLPEELLDDDDLIQHLDQTARTNGLVLAVPAGDTERVLQRLAPLVPNVLVVFLGMQDHQVHTFVSAASKSQLALGVSAAEEIGRTGLKALATLEKLRLLKLNKGFVEDDDLRIIAGMGGLRSLLAWVEISTTGCKALSGLSNLEGLMLSFSLPPAGMCTQYIGGLRGLTSLSLRPIGPNAGLAENAALQELGKLTSLRRLHFLATGPLPESDWATSGLSGLEHLRISADVSTRDVHQLAELKQLKKLEIVGTVGKSTLSELERKLVGCSIEVW